MGARVKNRFVAGLGGVLLVAGCAQGPNAGGAQSSSPVQMEFDGPEYASVDDLAGSSSIVVEGTFGDIMFSGPESEVQGPTTADALELPVTVRALTVTNVLAGDPGGGTILVQRVDTTAVVSDQIPVLEEDSTAVLFLRGAGKFMDLPLYSVTGLDQGRMNVDAGGALVAASSAIESLAVEVGALSSVTELDQQVSDSQLIDTPTS